MYESRRQSFPYKTEIIDWILNTRHLNDTHTTGNLCRFCDYVCHNSLFFEPNKNLRYEIYFKVFPANC